MGTAMRCRWGVCVGAYVHAASVVVWCGPHLCAFAPCMCVCVCVSTLCVRYFLLSNVRYIYFTCKYSVYFFSLFSACVALVFCTLHAFAVCIMQCICFLLAFAPPVVRVAHLAFMNQPRRGGVMCLECYFEFHAVNVYKRYIQCKPRGDFFRPKQKKLISKFKRVLF